jgi:hypothetical protein
MVGAVNNSNNIYKNTKDYIVLLLHPTKFKEKKGGRGESYN